MRLKLWPFVEAQTQVFAIELVMLAVDFGGFSVETHP